MVNEIHQVVAGQGFVVVNLAVAILRGRPGFPAEFRANDGLIGLTFKFRFGLPVLFEVIQVFEEKNPGGLLHIIQFAAAAGIFPEYRQCS